MSNKPNKTILRGDLDRIEDDTFAVIYIDHDEAQTEINIPVHLLPKDAEAGTSLRLTIEVDADDAKNRRARITSLRDKLLKN